MTGCKIEAWDISGRAKLESSIAHNHDQFQVAHPSNMQTALELRLRTTEIGSGEFSFYAAWKRHRISDLLNNTWRQGN